MLGIPDGIAAVLTLAIVLLFGRWFFGSAPPPRVDPPLVARYVIEHKTIKGYIGWWNPEQPHSGVRLVRPVDDAARFTSKQEAEAVRATFDSFRDTYHVVAIFEPEVPDAG